MNKTVPITRDQAVLLLRKHIKKDANFYHSLESEAVLRGLAEKLNEDANYWGMAGLLHDIDWEETENNPENHALKGSQILKEVGFDDEFCHAIAAHNSHYSKIEPQNKLDWAVLCGETITGLIYAAGLVRPNKLDDLETKSVIKKMKDKSFAANVRRDIIEKCVNLQLTKQEFIDIAINSMKKIKDQIGL